MNRLFDRSIARNLPTSNRAVGWIRFSALSLSILVLGVAPLVFSSPARPSNGAANDDPPAKSAAKRTIAGTKAAAPKAVAESPINKSYGSSSAPIKLEVFTDYQCPSCRSFFEGTLKPLIASDYISGGKVYLVHHDFPLQAHTYSGIAARWANAAAKIGRFPEAEAALYDNQDAWQANGDVAKYIAAAIPPADFKRIEALVKGCESPAPQSTWDKSNPLAKDPHPCQFDYAVADDVELGYKIPVQATPTYVITNKGQKLPAGSGVISWPILKQFFDSLLGQ